MDKRRESWEEEGKNDENLFPVFSERSQQDMSAIVSALTQVMGGNNNSEMHEASSIHNITQQSQLPQEDQAEFGYNQEFHNLVSNTSNVQQSNQQVPLPQFSQETYSNPYQYAAQAQLQASGSSSNFNQDMLRFYGRDMFVSNSQPLISTSSSSSSSSSGLSQQQQEFLRLSMQFGGSSSSSSAYEPPRNWGDGQQ
ncbi:hypothetical protein TSUD_318170 [Trifolium subterraneum]|uniref:Uncharacterized protein n=1 Tax=Trifolium subterraneum TaxID=3900 RepID=A0A2Z6NNE9_TRISU|nr:hypothetical protein TSUD_318170 [Trifolium subterraneum]